MPSWEVMETRIVPSLGVNEVEVVHSLEAMETWIVPSWEVNA